MVPRQGPGTDGRPRWSSHFRACRFIRLVGTLALQSGGLRAQPWRANVLVSRTFPGAAQSSDWPLSRKPRKAVHRRWRSAHPGPLLLSVPSCPSTALTTLPSGGGSASGGKRLPDFRVQALPLYPGQRSVGPRAIQLRPAVHSGTPASSQASPENEATGRERGTPAGTPAASVSDLSGPACGQKTGPALAQTPRGQAFARASATRPLAPAA